MPPRVPLFQRKGGKGGRGYGSAGAPQPPADAEPEQPGDSNDTLDGTPDPVVCPQCGCAFDPVTMEPVAGVSDQPVPQPPDAAAPPPAPGPSAGLSGGDLQSALAGALGKGTA